MQICKFWVSAALAMLAFAGCDVVGSDVSRKAPDQIALSDGMVVAGAQGWCVDSATRGSGSSVVVLASCAALMDNVDEPRPDVAGILTVSVEDARGETPDPDVLEAYFDTEAGRAALARDGQAESIEVLETVRQGDLLVIHAEDESAFPGTSGEYWRALFDLNGRFLSVSLIGPAGQPIRRADGLAALNAQVARLRVANTPG